MCFSNSIVTFYFTFKDRYIYICRQYLRLGLSYVFPSARLELKMRFLYSTPLCYLESICSFWLHCAFCFNFALSR